MLNKQYKRTLETSKTFQYSEGQLRLLYCDEISNSCPSLDLSFNEAKERLLNQGMSVENFDSLMGFLTRLAQQLIQEENRKITNCKQEDEYER